MPALLVMTCLVFSCPRAEAASFRDALGRTIVLPEHPRRIISLAPHLTEILFAIGAGPQVVGATTHCDYPEEARQVPRIGGYGNPSAERVLAARPDLIVVAAEGSMQGTVERLMDLGLPVFVTRMNLVQEIPHQVRLLGRLSGHRKAAEAVARDMERHLTHLIRRMKGRPGVQVYYQVWAHPFITVSDGSFVHDAIRLAGGVNVFGGLNQSHPRVSREAVLAARPEVMVLSSMGKEDSRLKEGWSRFPAIPAVANQRVYVMNSDLLHRPGPRIVQGIEQLARWFHPEAFKAGE